MSASDQPIVTWRCCKCGCDSITGGVQQKGRAHGIGGYCASCDRHNVRVHLSDTHRDAGIWCFRWEKPRRESLWVYVDEFGLCTNMVKRFCDFEGASIEEFRSQMQSDHPEMTTHRVQFEPVKSST